MAANKTMENQEFQYLPLKSIILEKQIRSSIDKTTESFKALVASIKEKGVLEPVLVTPKDDKYLLLCGERRYLAAYNAGLEIIPARVVNTITQKDEILAIQLTENLQREDLNPIDQANGMLAYIKAKHPDKNYNVDGVMSDLVSYNRRPEGLAEEIALTVRAIIEISAKSIQTLHRTISLLKLVPKIQDVISAGTLPVSQGYLFAANLGTPDFFTIFDEILETPVTNAVLEKKLTAYKRRKPKSTEPKPIPMKIKVASLQTIESYFEKKTGMYAKSNLQTFLDELKVLSSLIEQQIKTAPESVPIKPVTKPVPQI
ncbi:MAG: ParB/RepB/Spo0J family partition protein [Proteobacteria bacterium]|nr:ParB/RepB/Spo0J family partition protein [Pseudomonadota bacterium]